MNSEYAANVSLQTKHQGKSLVVKKEGKHATIGSLLQSWATKFVGSLAVLLVVKQFI